MSISDYLLSPTGPSTSQPVNPYPAVNRLGLFGATLSDAANAYRGQPSDNLSRLQQMQIGNAQFQQTEGAKKAALAAFLSAKTPEEKQAAAVSLWGAGGDPTGLASALNIGKPEVKSFGTDQSLYSIGPDGLPKLIQQGVKETRPVTAGGTVSLDNGKTWKPIPGYVDQAAALSSVRAHAKPAAAGAIAIPHPGSMF